jgi:cell wall-associated NlpC family hydrolase
MTSRSEVVAAARGWIDTPFHHQARLKGVGVDCAGLVIGIARELGLVAPDFDVTAYPRQPDGKSLLAFCDAHMQRIERAALRPGDVLVVSFDADPQHVGVLGDYWHGNGVLSIIHSASNVSRGGRVVEQRLMFSNSMRFVAAYALPGVT